MLKVFFWIGFEEQKSVSLQQFVHWEKCVFAHSFVEYNIQTRQMWIFYVSLQIVFHNEIFLFIYQKKDINQHLPVELLLITI